MNAQELYEQWRASDGISWDGLSQGIKDQWGRLSQDVSNEVEDRYKQGYNEGQSDGYHEGWDEGYEQSESERDDE